MEAVIFVGIQATGKSTFYASRFAHTHVRINMDMLKTRHREQRFIQTCIETGQPFVVDNTNPTPDDRARYIVPARAAGFRIVGYFFRSRIDEALERNNGRPERQRVPERGVRGTHGRLVVPCRQEGFDEMFFVSLLPPAGFSVEDWRDEVR